MIKLIYCLRRQSHLTRAQFQEYWLHTHAPLVRDNADALHVRRYVQVHTADDPVNAALQAGRGAPEPYDGIAELWFDSVESMQAAGGTAEGKAALKALRADEARFIDQANSPVWVSHEHAIVGDAT